MGVWVEIDRFPRPCPFRVAMDIGQHRQQCGGMSPRKATASLPHGDQLAEGERTGIEAEDPSKLPDELIHFCASISGSIV